MMKTFWKVWMYSWHYTHGYARTQRLGKPLYMHRLIMCAESVQEVDHEDGNTLNNVKSNLRLCNHQQNLANIKRKGGNESKGVSLMSNGKWKAYIGLNYKQIHLGVFDTKQSAKNAYNKAAIKLFGEFARTNKMLEVV